MTDVDDGDDDDDDEDDFFLRIFVLEVGRKVNDNGGINVFVI